MSCHRGGDCNGGEPSSVYEWAFSVGLPHSSCEQYVAHNNPLSNYDCTAMDICKDCTPPACPFGETCQDNCWAVDYKKYFVSSYYGVAGAEQMKSEIFANGPISCGIQASANLEDNYKEGIWRQYIKLPDLNHEIAVVGWDVDSVSGDEYWIVRNSWGTYWGNNGFFYLPIGDQSLNLGV
jgi:cathepsin X